MADILTYPHSPSFGINQYSSGSYQLLLRVRPNVKMILSSIGFFTSANRTSVPIRPQVFDAFGSLVSANSSITVTNTSSTVPTWVDLTTPAVLDPAFFYYVGAVMNYSTYYSSSSSADHSHSADGLSLLIPNDIARMRIDYGEDNVNTFPDQSYRADEMPLGFRVEPFNKLPTEPTGLVVPGSPVKHGDPINASWTHNDPNANPQSKYQLRWRMI